MLKQLLFALLGLTHLAEAEEVWYEMKASNNLKSDFYYRLSILDSYIEEDETGVPQLW